MIDFSDCRIDPFRAYDGANGSKICVFYQNERYMLKFPVLSKDNKDMHYTNGCLNEHMVSQLYQSLGLETQKTLYGTYKGKEVVACKDFCQIGERIVNFGMMKNQCIDSEHGGYGTELSSVLEAIEMQQLYDPLLLTRHFWLMFAADALFGNFDRHNGNWGVIINEATQHVRIAPIYDNGSCMYPQLTDEQMAAILKDPVEIENRIFVFPNSALKQNGRKINYVEFLKNTKDPACIHALRYVQNNYDSNKVKEIISGIPMSDIKKTFYETMLEQRKKKVIDASLKQSEDDR